MNNRTQNQFLISIILPSRKRPKELKNTINSFISLADPALNNFEIIIKIDFDDHESLDYIKTLDNKYENITFLINSRLKGWYNLVDFFEDLIRVSKSKYMFGFNDDGLMLTQNWNRILEEKLNEFKIYYPQVIWDIDLNGHLHDFREAFPIYPKKLVEKWGYLCPHNNIDNWILEIGKRCTLDPWNEDIIEYIDDLYIRHSQIPDESSKEKLETVNINHNLRDYHMNSPELYHCINLLKEHLEYLRWEKIHQHNIINEYKNSLES
jgi:hypothetical protein